MLTPRLRAVCTAALATASLTVAVLLSRHDGRTPDAPCLPLALLTLAPGLGVPQMQGRVPASTGGAAAGAEVSLAPRLDDPEVAVVSPGVSAVTIDDVIRGLRGELTDDSDEPPACEGPAAPGASASP